MRQSQHHKEIIREFAAVTDLKLAVILVLYVELIPLIYGAFLDYQTRLRVIIQRETSPYVRHKFQCICIASASRKNELRMTLSWPRSRTHRCS